MEVEERYRAEVRQRQNSSTSGVTVLVVIGAVVLGLWAINRYNEAQRAREEVLRPLVERGIMK